MDTRTECVFGGKCYRKNPHHFREYKHKHLSELLKVNNPDLLLPSDDNIDRNQFRIFATIEAEFSKKDDQNVSQPSQSDEAKESSSKKRSRSPSPKTEESKKLNLETKRKKSNIEMKLEAAAPYNFFLTKVKDNPSTHKAANSLYITDLLHPSLGKLKATLQINFMVDLEWLLMNYEVYKTDDIPLVILYGAENPELSSPNFSECYPNIRAVRVKPKYPYGTHHTKMMVLLYEDGGVRVVVHTANLVPGDWENRTQGVWVSPRQSER